MIEKSPKATVYEHLTWSILRKILQLQPGSFRSYWSGILRRTWGSGFERSPQTLEDYYRISDDDEISRQAGSCLNMAIAHVL